MGLLEMGAADEFIPSFCLGAGCDPSAPASARAHDDPGHEPDDPAKPSHGDSPASAMSFYGPGWLNPVSFSPMPELPPFILTIQAPRGELVVGGYITAGGTFVPQTGTKAELNDKDAKRFKSERLAALGRLAFSTSCRDFLEKHGIDVKGLMDAVWAEKPYDGKRSTVTRGEAGVVDPNNPNDVRYSNVPLRNSFGSSGSSGAETAIYPGGVFGLTVSDRSTVFFRSSSINAGTILHEALHSLLGETDSQLQQRIGITVGDPSKNITDKLIAEGCAEEVKQ